METWRDRKYKLEETCRSVIERLKKLQGKCHTTPTRLISVACDELIHEISKHDFHKDMVGAITPAVSDVRTMILADIKPTMIAGVLVGQRSYSLLERERSASHGK